MAMNASASRLGTASATTGDVSEVVERGGRFAVYFLGTVRAPWLTCRQSGSHSGGRLVRSLRPLSGSQFVEDCVRRMFVMEQKQ